MKVSDELWKAMGGHGWLTRPEADLLYTWAIKSDGNILEVGCYAGRSTIMLASLGRHVFAVDPFTLNPEVKQEFIERVLDTHNNVRLYICPIEDFAPVPCSFAYLDGDHSYQGTVNQINKAFDCGVQYVAVHDVNDKGGGLEVKRACMELLGPWVERVERMAVWNCSKDES